MLLVAIGAGGWCRYVSVRALARARANGYNCGDWSSWAAMTLLSPHAGHALRTGGWISLASCGRRRGRLRAGVWAISTTLRPSSRVVRIFTSGSGWHDGLRERGGSVGTWACKPRCSSSSRGDLGLFIVPIEGTRSWTLRRPPRTWGRDGGQAGVRYLRVRWCTVLSPVLLTVAAAVKLTSEGQCSSRRARGNGRTFRIPEFRSMVVNASIRAKLEAQNEMDGPVFKIKRDPRITSVGHFIRKTASTSSRSSSTCCAARCPW